jgi:hypothetical protein
MAPSASKKFVMSDGLTPLPDSTPGYRRLLDRQPELKQSVAEFETWLSSVEIWLNWIEKNIPEGTHATRAEILEDFHFTPLGLELLTRLGVDIYPDEDTESKRTHYDVKKLLRAVVALPTLARLKRKKLVRKGRNITSIFKEVIDDTLNGRINIDDISTWEQPPVPEEQT